jgi:hypothetical protein
MQLLSHILCEASKDAILVSMPQEGVLVIRRSRDNKWAEVRGEYNSQSHNNDFQKVIDAMTGGHVSILFAKDEVFLTSERDPEEYAMFDQIIKNGALPTSLPRAKW